MKKMIMLLLVAGISSFFSSCSKDDDNSSNNGGLTSGQWTLVKAVYKDTVTKEEDTEPYDAGSYLRFDNNGICYSMVDGETNSSNWNYIDDGKGVFIDNSNGFDVNDEGYTIETLTSSSLVLLSKEYFGTQEQRLYLTK